MSIVSYVGYPGSGKSYAAVEHQILPMLRSHRIVVTNVPLKLDLIRKDIPGCDVREFPLGAIAQQPELITEAVPPGAILVLDEVWRLFPAGTKANQVPEPFRMLFAEHRHRVDAAGNSTQIVLVTQDLAQIGAFARQLVDQTFRVTKLSTLGIPMSNRYRVDMYPGAVAGPNPPAANRIRQMFGRYEKKVYQYYISHTQSEAGEDTAPNEAGADKRANIFKKPFLMALPFIAVAALALVWFKGGYLLQKYRGKPAQTVTAGAASGATGAAVPSSQKPSLLGSVVAKVEGAGDWHIIGTVRNVAHAEKSVAVLRSEALKAQVSVPLSRCVGGEGDVPLRCQYDGFSYTEGGHGLGDLGFPVGSYSSGGAVAALTPGAVTAVTREASDESMSPYTEKVFEEDPVTGVVGFVDHAYRDSHGHPVIPVQPASPVR